jgi:hypothetical protein
VENKNEDEDLFKYWGIYNVVKYSPLILRLVNILDISVTNAKLQKLMNAFGPKKRNLN